MSDQMEDYETTSTYPPLIEDYVPPSGPSLEEENNQAPPSHPRSAWEANNRTGSPSGVQNSYVFGDSFETTTTEDNSLSLPPMSGGDTKYLSDIPRDLQSLAEENEELKKQLELEQMKHEAQVGKLTAQLEYLSLPDPEQEVARLQDKLKMIQEENQRLKDDLHTALDTSCNWEKENTVLKEKLDEWDQLRQYEDWANEQSSYSPESMTPTDARPEQTMGALQDLQEELEKSRNLLQQKEAELEQTMNALHTSQRVLEEVKKKLEESQNTSLGKEKELKLTRSTLQIELEETKKELEGYMCNNEEVSSQQVELEETKKKLERISIEKEEEISRLQTKLEETQKKIKEAEVDRKSESKNLFQKGLENKLGKALEECQRYKKVCYIQ